MTLDHDTLQDIIQADLDGALSAAQRADLARVLLQDPEARRLHDEYRKLDQMLRDIPAAEPPPDLQAKLPPLVTARQQSDWSFYRMAAVFLGGLLIIGLSYVLLNTDVRQTELQGSMIAATTAKDTLSLRAEGVELGASLDRQGDTLRLSLDVSTTLPYEIVAHTGSADGPVVIEVSPGRNSLALAVTGDALIHLQLRSGGRVLAEGTLSPVHP